jgi:flagellar hook-associated protein 2
MALISAGGLASGLDTEGLIAKLMEAERRPVTLLESRKARLDDQAAAFKDLNTKLLALKTQADALKDPAKFYPRTVTSSVDTVATATASVGSARGTHTITVTQLATNSIAAAGVTKAALTDVVAAGDGTFEFKLGPTGTVVSVPVTAATTLDELVTAINDKNAGVKAAAVNVGSSTTPAYKLTLTSVSTGAASDIVVVTDGTTLTVANTQAGQDSLIDISGIGTGIARPTNVVSDVLDGVTITLKDEGTTDLTVDLSVPGLQAAVQGLVNAYNDVIKSVAVSSTTLKTPGGTVIAAPFTGEVLPRAITSTLASAVSLTTSGLVDSLVQLGITRNSKDGTLTLDATKFQSVVTANVQGTSDLIAGTSTADGVADLLSRAADEATKSVTGTITIRQDGITATTTSLQKQIDAMLERLSASEQRHRARFVALETTIAQLQATQSSLAGQLSSLENLARSLSSAQ